MEINVLNLQDDQSIEQSRIVLGFIPVVQTSDMGVDEKFSEKQAKVTNAALGLLLGFFTGDK